MYLFYLSEFYTDLFYYTRQMRTLYYIFNLYVFLTHPGTIGLYVPTRFCLPIMIILH